MHPAKFGLNRAHRIGAMVKCGINGAFATNVAHFTFVVKRSVIPPNSVPIGLYLPELRSLKALETFWYSWDLKT